MATAWPDTKIQTLEHELAIYKECNRLETLPGFLVSLGYSNITGTFM